MALVFVAVLAAFLQALAVQPHIHAFAAPGAAYEQIADGKISDDGAHATVADHQTICVICQALAANGSATLADGAQLAALTASSNETTALAIGLAVVVSIFFIVANTMAMAARERTTEVAVLKTLGFRQGQVISLILFESLAVGLIGAILGCAVAAGVLGGAARALENVFPFFGTLSMTPRAWGNGIAVGLAVGLLSGLIPAITASRLKIVDALRRVA